MALFVEEHGAFEPGALGMVRTEEIHGLFQCLEISSSEDEHEFESVDASVFDPTIVKEGWFMDPEETTREAARLKNLKWANPNDFTVAKYQIDLLFFQQRYREAFDVALASFEFHKRDLRREIVDILVRCLVKLPAEDRPKGLLEECAGWFDGRAEHVRDAGLCWLRATIAEAMGDWEAGLRACDAFLEIRPGDLCVWQWKRKLAGRLDSPGQLLQEINETIRILEHNLTR